MNKPKDLKGLHIKNAFRNDLNAPSKEKGQVCRVLYCSAPNCSSVATCSQRISDYNVRLCDSHILIFKEIRK